MKIWALAALLLASACQSSGRGRDAGEVPDADIPDPPDMTSDAMPDLLPKFDPDGACAVVSETAQVDVLPVDIIWMVDNSASMAPAVAAVTAGLNDFAALVAGMNLDYHIVILSLRSKTSPISLNGSTRYPICIPQPLAGDDMCGNGPRFVHSHIDIRSTQPLEQFLGSLAQTDGYRVGQDRGGEPWAAALRPEATKTIVVVSDDNSRLSPTDFETFAGGRNPNIGSFTLPPGILDPSWKGLFDGYTFDGIYGYGSDVDPFQLCSYANGSKPPASGAVYSFLVAKTTGVRASICDGAAAWQGFFAQVAQSVVRTAKLTCNLAIPMPQGQQSIDPERVNVVVVANNQTRTTLPKVKDAAACGATNGWYYDDDLKPTRVLLCKQGCDFAQAQVTNGGSIEIAFGCDTVVQ